MTKISQLLAAHFAQHGYTAQWAAGFLGVSKATYANWLAGRTVPTLGSLGDLSLLLSMEVDELLLIRRADKALKKRAKATNMSPAAFEAMQRKHEREYLAAKRRRRYERTTPKRRRRAQ